MCGDHSLAAVGHIHPELGHHQLVGLEIWAPYLLTKFPELVVKLGNLSADLGHCFH